MTRGQAIEMVMAGILADVEGYRQLHDLLEAQFAAALRHETARIAEVGEKITETATAMENRRVERVSLVRRLIGAAEPKPMQALFGVMSASRRQLAESSWRELEERVRDCKALNERNCRLLMDQYEIMQHVLNGEADIYVPA